MTVEELQRRVEAACRAEETQSPPASVRQTLEDLLDALERGQVRAAMPTGEGGWQVATWVKAGLLLGFRTGTLREYALGPGFRFHDKDLYPPREADPGQVRLVPWGSTVRRGTYLGRSIVIMPPSYINVGAYVDDGTMVDSHVLVGSCAQVGRRVHLSAGVQLGGVLEPVGARPVIVEDEVMVGGQVGLYEGVRVCRGAVLGAGVILTGTSRLHDLVHEREWTAQPGSPLEVPAGAVVVPGSRPARGEYARHQGLHLSTALIVKYRDARTGTRTTLEEDLR